MTLIIDTSVIVKWFVKEDGHEKALELLASGKQLYCPDFAFLEATNVLWRKVRMNEISGEQAQSATVAMLGFFDRVIAAADIVTEAYLLASKLEHSVYDCAFLAASLRSPEFSLVTDDKIFSKKCANTGYADKIRLLNNGPLTIEISENKLTEIISLVTKYQEVEDFVLDSIRPQSEGVTFCAITLGDMRPAFDSPIYRKLGDLVSDINANTAREIIAICWYGREVGSQGFEKDYENSLNIAFDTQANGPYIIGLLPHFEAGLTKLKDTHPQLFKKTSD